MIDHTPLRLLFIRTSIFLLRRAPLLEALLLTTTSLALTLLPKTLPFRPALTLTNTLLALLTATELTYALTIYLPHRRRLLQPAQHPPPSTRADRERLFARCLANIPDPKRYQSLWCLGAPLADIGRANVREFFLWAFFDRDHHEDNTAPEQVLSAEEAAEAEEYIARAEALMGHQFPPGRRSARSLRLTIDPIDTVYRSVLWYGIIAGADLVTHVRMVLEILPVSCRLTDPLLPREEFVAHVKAILARHNGANDWDEFVLVSHSYGSVLTTHVLRDEELGPRVKGTVLVDPVSVMLHLPDVAYNFTRRPPTTANEWQLWYFASTDLGVAEGLGRYFFWRENVIWKEELLALPESKSGGKEVKTIACNGHSDAGVVDGHGNGHTGRKTRRVAVCLAGRDLIVDTRTVARYLAAKGDLRDIPEEGLPVLEQVIEDRKTDSRHSHRSLSTPAGIDILWFPQLDHAQVFEDERDRRRIVDVVRRYCRVDR